MMGLLLSVTIAKAPFSLSLHCTGSVPPAEVESVYTYYEDIFSVTAPTISRYIFGLDKG